VSPRSRVPLILAAVALLIGGFLLAKNSDSDDDSSTTTTQAATPPATTTAAATTAATPTPTPAPEIETITITGGKPEGGVADIEVDKGDTVRFKVVSDVADEIHVHGYDLMKDVEAGGSVSFKFKADIDGKFEIELEDAGEQIASLTVNP